MADRQDTGGLTTALQLLAAAQGSSAGGGGEQDDLFDDLPSALPSVRPPERTGRPGRPLGVRNRSTDWWLSYLSARYQSPLIGLAETWSRPARQLAEDLELYKWHEGKPVLDAEGNHVLDTGAAATLQQQARIAALPYWHRKQPMAIEVEQKQRGVVLIGDLDITDLGSDDDLALPLAPLVENQGVNEAMPAPVGQQKSDAQGSSSNFNGMTDADI